MNREEFYKARQAARKQLSDCYKYSGGWKNHKAVWNSIPRIISKTLNPSFIPICPKVAVYMHEKFNIDLDYFIDPRSLEIEKQSCNH